MNDIAKNMADRIRGTLMPDGKAAASLAAVSGSSVHGRAKFVADASRAFENAFGVGLDEVTDLFEPKNDIVYASAEEGVSPADFVTTLGTRFAFDSVDGKDGDYARYLRSGNEAKLALAQFAASSDDWTFSDGYAVAERDGGSFVMAPHYDEAVSSWQFASYGVPCSRDEFSAMDRAGKAAVPSEGIVYGDIDDCARIGMELQAAPAALRM